KQRMEPDAQANAKKQTKKAMKPPLQTPGSSEKKDSESATLPLESKNTSSNSSGLQASRAVRPKQEWGIASSQRQQENRRSFVQQLVRSDSSKNDKQLNLPRPSSQPITTTSEIKERDLEKPMAKTESLPAPGRSTTLSERGEVASPPAMSRGGAATPERSVTSRDKDILELDADSERETVFYYREYSWNRTHPPASLAPKTAWSQTIYWNPLATVPASGKLVIPLELPTDAASLYQFDVFGHDGQGRLGTASVDIRPTALTEQKLPLSLKTVLSHTEARVGDVVQLQCVLENRTSRRQPNIVLHLQLPEGLKLPENMKQLRQMLRTNASDNYQEPARFTRSPQGLHFHWSELPTEQPMVITLDLVCEKAGNFRALPSRAYLENQQQDTCQSPGLEIEVNK
ncbi:MAG TPA: hypothetical protein PKA06_07280, partial [Gemmatales bacterium]|nr:hypothetical protein [Gemmatales bacterium]